MEDYIRSAQVKKSLLKIGEAVEIAEDGTITYTNFVKGDIYKLSFIAACTDVNNTFVSLEDFEGNHLGVIDIEFIQKIKT